MFEKILRIKKQERKIFKQHFLKGVVLQLQFDINIYDYIKNNETKFASYLKQKKYTKREYLYQKKCTFSFSQKKSMPKDEPPVIIGVGYSNFLCGNKIQLINDTLVFIQTDYNGFESLLEAAKEFLDIVNSEFQIKKIGHRKINSIVARDVSDLADITSLFHESVFASLRYNLFSLNALDNYQNSLTLVKNNLQCIINTTCARIKNIKSAYEITLDMDLVYTDNIKKDDLAKILSEINDDHFNIFYQITSDKMKKVLNME